MSSPLQKAPDGLLGALDLKTLGHSPSQWPDTLQGVIEATPYYLLRNRRAYTGGAAFAAINATIFAHTVPDSDVWRVKALSVIIARAAADIALNIEILVALRRATNTFGTPVFAAIFAPVAVTDLGQSRGLQLPEPIWMGPGDRLSIVSSTTMTIAGSSVAITIDVDVMQSG